ncbi:hypothetical protein KJ359_003172 [Pestalotiopsis sp. 9143b]|nr:hypothetical protein KJ359_003172 [Pestalotiopsis sp. 9143b]
MASLSHNAKQLIALGAKPSQSLLYKAIAGEEPGRYRAEELGWDEPDQSQPDWDLIRFFFSHGARLDLNNPPPDYRRNLNPLILIIQKLSEEEDYDNFELILKSLSEPLSPEQGFECLVMATCNPVHPRPVKALMEAGVDINYWPSGGRSILAHLVGTFEGLQYDFDPYTRSIDLGSSDEMVDTLKLVLEAGARLGPSDLSTSEMRDIYQRIRHVAENAWDEQVWSGILLPEPQEDVRDFLDNMGESLCRLSFKGGKIVIKNRDELGPEDVDNDDEDEDSEVESQDEESELEEDDYDDENGAV